MWNLSFLLAQGDTPASTPTAAASKLTQWIDTGREFLQTQGPQFAVNIVGALLVFVIGKSVAGLLTRIVARMLERAQMEQMLVSFVSNVMYYLLLAVVVMAALDMVGVDTTSFAAVLAAAGFAIGMALQGSLGNFAAGVMLIVFKPFQVGDFVEAGGTSGTVEEIQIFNTLMRTGDNRLIIVPNGHVTGSTITNYSARPQRRIDLVIGCGYGDDLLAVKNFLMSALKDDPRVIEDPAPTVSVADLGSSSVNFNVRPWVKSEDYWAVRSDLTERIKLGFDKLGFNFPYPSQDVYMHQT